MKLLQTSAPHRLCCCCDAASDNDDDNDDDDDDDDDDDNVSRYNCLLSGCWQERPVSADQSAGQPADKLADFSSLQSWQTQRFLYFTISPSTRVSVVFL